MKSKLIIFILAFCTLSAVTSCTDRKQQLINKLEKLSKKLDRQGNDLSITQWQQAAKQFKQLNEDIAKNYRLNNFMKLADSKAFALALLADIYHIP